MSSPLHRSLRMVVGLTLAATLASVPTQAATTVGGQPSGVMTAELAVGTHPLSFPLIRDEVFAGIVTGNTGSTVTFSSGDVAAALVSGSKYYLEIVTGAMEGDRLDVASASGSVATVTLAATSNSTLPALGTNALAGARVVVRQHVTLKAIAAMFTPGLAGNNSAASADHVLVYQNGGLATYYLRGDGLSWREPGKTVDQRDYVIPPDASILVNLKSGAKRWAHSGGVRANGFRVNLVAGTRAFATGFPVDLSFTEIGGLVDTQQSSSVRWVGNVSASVADTVQIYASTFSTYYLRDDGSSWRAVGDTTNLAGEKLLTGRGMFLVKRTNADADYFILRPYAL